LSEDGSGQALRATRQLQLDVESFESPEARLAAQRVNAIDWYHALDLPHGISTPGRADHRAQVDLYGLPEDLRGVRALDVATFDGFWAFEMERRGAEVMAIDIGSWLEADIPLPQLGEVQREGKDKTTGAGFHLAHELLESRVERRVLSVYDLSPAVAGTFDLVMMSDLLLHLRDPQRALENIRAVTRDDGLAIVAEPYHPDLEKFGNTALTQFIGFDQLVWSIPSSYALKAMLGVAGFQRVEEVARLRLDYDHPFPVEKIVLRAQPIDPDEAR
jgi:tRNA (mo5U34)-methyltransferase